MWAACCWRGPSVWPVDTCVWLLNMANGTSWLWQPDCKRGGRGSTPYEMVNAMQAWDCRASDSLSGEVMTVWEGIGVSGVEIRIPEVAIYIFSSYSFLSRGDQVQECTSWHVRCCEDFLNLPWKASFMGFWGLFCFLFNLVLFYSRWVLHLAGESECIIMSLAYRTACWWTLVDSFALWSWKLQGGWERAGKGREGKEVGIFQ